MKKVIFLFCILLLAEIGNAQVKKANTPAKKPIAKPATPKYIATRADTAAVNFMTGELCACLTPIVDSIPKIFLTMLEEMSSLGEDKAMENFMNGIAKLTPTEKQEIDDVKDFLQSLDSENSPFKACINKLEKKYGNLKFKETPGKNEVMEQMMEDAMKVNCAKAKVLMELGKKLKED